MEKLKALFGFSAEEDPLKKEVEEMRRAAKAAVKEAERREKQVRKTEKAGKIGGGGLSFLRRSKGSNPKREEAGGLSRAVEEVDSIFAELEQL